MSSAEAVRGAPPRVLIVSACADPHVGGDTVIRIPAWNGPEHRWGVPFPLCSPHLASEYEIAGQPGGGR
jgi:hypothetical protein